MTGLRSKFGACVRAHRRRQNLTQEGLAEKASISSDMVAKIELGTVGASFETVEKLSHALLVEPFQLFTIDLQPGSFAPELTALVERLAALSADDLVWLERLIGAALHPRTRSSRPGVSP